MLLMLQNKYLSLRNILFQLVHGAASHWGRDKFARMASKAAEFYRSVGQTSAKILSMDQTAISREYSMVKVDWGVTFAKTGNKLIEFDVKYFIQKTGLEPKIIMFIAHQDEEKAMKELGLSGLGGLKLR